MLLPLSLLQLAELLLPVSLLVGAAVAKPSAFNIKAHGTGYRYQSGTSNINAKDINVTTTNDLSYTVEIFIGGESFTVILDTGSTDLWVNTKNRNVKLVNTTDLTTGIAYGKGQVLGNIDFAEVKIGDFVIESQAFLNPSEITDFDTAGVDGIMGMGFDVANIYNTIQRAWGTAAADTLGRAPITSLFAQNPTLPNNFDVQLGRTSELDDVADGTFLISAHDPDFAKVTAAPLLPRIDATHWSIVMDAMHINGKQFAFNKSRIMGAPAGKVVAALDTGFSFPPLPPPAVDAIYGSIPGAKFDPVGDMWIVPCTAATNLSFTFSGQEFYVHPLDLTFPLVTEITVDGAVKNITACINTYQYLTLDPNSFAGFDIILGDAFLRNVYASFDYGDYYPANHTNGLPFVQMVSTTNPATMWQEFRDSRAAALKELPAEFPPDVVVKYDAEQAASTQAPQQFGATGSAASESDSSEEGGDSWSKKYGTLALALLGANLAVGLAVLGVTLTMCVRGTKGKSGSRYAPVRFKEAAGDDYERGAMKYSD
ncbi:aspartic peptidase domain-containing protein [Daedaleopsis nitida]|nr:aspartic peptidase domain-containing protein [Daedaleopsis nitida]